MLVLERKLHEGFWIEDRIFVKVLGIGKRRVKLGIEAPLDSHIVRAELKNTNQAGGDESSVEVQYWTGPLADQSMAYSGIGSGYCSGLPPINPYRTLDRIGCY